MFGFIQTVSRQAFEEPGIDIAINDIFSILQDFGPDIFSIVEANYLIGSNFSFKDYNLDYSRIHTMSNISQTVLLIRDNILYIWRYDLESPLISSIWVEINISKNNRLLV